MSLLAVYGVQVQDSGDLVARDLIHSNDYHVRDIDSGGLTVSKSYFVRDSILEDVQETSRVVHGISSEKEFGSLYMQTLRTDGVTSVKNLPVTLSTVSEASTITTTTDSLITTATFSNSGLSFDSNTSSIFFGSSKTFRIKYESTTPPRLLFQAYNTTSSEYETKYSIL